MDFSNMAFPYSQNLKNTPNAAYNANAETPMVT